MGNTDWRVVIENDNRLPGGLTQEDAVAELSEALRSPDPAVRDGQAYTALNRLIPNLDPALLRGLGDEMAARFTDPQIQARTFAPLVLAWIVEADVFEPAWVAAFAAWYPAETDLRGRDPELGWLHAVAHGSDLLGVFGRYPKTEPAPLLHLATARLLAPTDYLLADQEDDRLAHAIALTLTREELTAQESVAWLAPIAADFTNGKGRPAPAYASNTMRTLRALYVLVDRGVRLVEGDEPVAVNHRDAVKQRLADVLAIVAPFAG